LASKLAELQRRTGKGTTYLVREALESYCGAARRSSEPLHLLADFVACADGPRALSTTYKTDLGRLLERKG
jgi:hypothetical protein